MSDACAFKTIGHDETTSVATSSADDRTTSLKENITGDCSVICVSVGHVRCNSPDIHRSDVVNTNAVNPVRAAQRWQ